MSLAAQLANIAAPKQQGSQKRNTRASIVYTPREAADLSLDSLHETAQNAFVELCRVDPHLERFESSLFSQSARHINRELNDPETNEQLDVDIANFLRAVSPYLLLSFTPHVLEYLVRRFEIHLYNVEAVLECILPFHETSLFSKILPLLAFQADQRWNFLKKAQQNRSPIARQTVVDSAVRNVAIVDFFWSMAQRVVGSDVGSSNGKIRKHNGSEILVALSSSAAKSTLTFCTVILVETSRRLHSYGGEESTSYIRRTLPHLLHSIGFKRSYDYVTMGYMLATQLCHSFAISVEIYQALSTAVAKSVLRQASHKSKKKSNGGGSGSQALMCDPTILNRALTCLASMHTACDSRTNDSLKLTPSVMGLLSSSTTSGRRVISELLSLSRPSTSKNNTVEKSAVVVPIMSTASSYVRQTLSSPSSDLSLVMEIMEALSCGHLIHDILSSCVKANSSATKNDDHLRTLSRWYPEETNAAIRDVVSNSRNRNVSSGSENDDSSDSESDNTSSSATNSMARIVDIFAGTRFRPIDDQGTSLFMALRHPSVTLRLNALNVLSSSSKTMKRDRFLFDALFRMIATDSEPSVIASAAEYVVDVSLWEVVSTNKKKDELSSGALELAITSVCRAIEHWRENSSGGSVVSDSDREILLCRLLQVAAGLSEACRTRQDRFLILRPLTRLVTSLLPIGKAGNKDKSSNKSFTKVQAAAIHCAVLASLLPSSLEANCDTTTTSYDVLVAIATRLSKEKNVRQYVSMLCHEPSGFNGGVLKQKRNGEWLIMDALCEASVLNDSNSNFSIEMATLLLEYALPQFVQTFYGTQGEEAKYVMPRVFEILSKHYAKNDAAANVSSTTKNKKRSRDSSKSISSNPANVDSHYILDAWDSFVSGRRLPKFTTSHPILVFFMTLGSLSKTMSTAIVLQELMSTIVGSHTNDLTVGQLMSFVNRRGDDEEHRTKYAPWSMNTRTACLELTRLHWLSSSSSSSSPPSLSLQGVEFGSVLIAMQSSSQQVRKSASRCLVALAGLNANQFACSTNNGGNVSGNRNRLFNVEVPDSNDVLLFTQALEEESKELLSDRYYLRTAIAKHLSKGGKNVIKLFQWVLSDCSRTLFHSDSHPVAMLFRSFESMPPILIIETAGASLLANAINNNSKMLPSAEMVRIILSQYQRITQPKQFTSIAFEVLQLLIRSEWVLKEGSSPSNNVEYVVREDALAAVTKKLCSMMNSEQNDDTFKLLVRMKSGRTEEDEATDTTTGTLESVESKRRKREASDTSSSSSTISESHLSVRFSGLVHAAMSNVNVSDDFLMDMVRKLQSSDAYASVDAWLVSLTLTSEVVGVKSESIAPHMCIRMGHALISCLLQFIRSVKDGVNSEDTTTRSQQEFACVLLLSATHKLFLNGESNESKKHTGKKEEDESKRTVKTIVKCIQWTASSQVRNQGLALLSHLASTASTAVLGCLVPVFSFVGKDLATASEDNYTFNVVRKILQVVVPALPSEHMHAVMNVFVGSFDAMLPHRRLELFNAMINSMKGNQNGKNSNKASKKSKKDDILAYLVASFVSHNLELNDDEQRGERMKCCHDICGSFKLLDQIHMIKRLVHISTADLEAESDEENEEEDDKNIESGEELLSTLPLLAKTPMAINDVRLQLMYYVNHHLSKKSFLKKLHQLQLAIKKRESSGRSEATHLVDARSTMETDILSACERILYEIQDLEDGASPITLLYHEILGQMTNMLTVPSFLVVVTALLESDGAATVRQRALQLLNERVVEDAHFFDGAEIDLFLELVDELSSKAFQNKKLLPGVQQAYLYSLGILASSFAAEHPNRFVHMLTPLSNILKCNTASDLSVAALRSTTFCTLATLCTKLGPRVLPILPTLVPSLMNDISGCVISLRNAKEEVDSSDLEKNDSTATPNTATTTTTTILLRGALTALVQVLKHIPQFMTPYVRSILTMVLSDDSNNLMGPPELAAITEMNLLICQKHEPRILLPILNNMIDQAKGETMNEEKSSTLSWTDAAVTRTFDTVTMVVERMSTKDARIYHKDIHNVCLKACSKTIKSWSDGRDSIVECLVTVMLKLSERRMKPMFLNIVNWSIENKRHLFLYSLVISLSDKLKSIFTPFYEYVLTHVTNDMTRFLVYQQNTNGTDDDSSSDEGDGRNGEQGGRSGKRRKIRKGSNIDNAAREYERIEMAATCLLNCFTYDNAATTANVKDYVPFITKGRFDLINEPLTELIGTAHLLNKEHYANLMEDVVTPCIAQFAAAVEDDMMRKTIHHKLLMHSRNDTAIVRVHTINTIKACFNQVGEDYLYLVPETLPFLAELLEDSNGQVERLAHELKRQVEELSGEGLDTYLVGE